MSLPLQHKMQIIDRIEQIDIATELYRMFNVQREEAPSDPNIPHSPNRYKYDQNKRTADVLVAKILGGDYDNSLGMGLDDYYMEMDILTTRYLNDEKFRQECSERFEFVKLALQTQKDMIEKLQFPIRGSLVGKDLGMI